MNVLLLLSETTLPSSTLHRLAERLQYVYCETGVAVMRTIHRCDALQVQAVVVHVPAHPEMAETLRLFAGMNDFVMADHPAVTEGELPNCFRVTRVIVMWPGTEIAEREAFSIATASHSIATCRTVLDAVELLNEADPDAVNEIAIFVRVADGREMEMLGEHIKQCIDCGMSIETAYFSFDD
jgi:hypothetical protein